VWFKKKPNPKPSFPIGAYALEMMLIEGPSLREISPAECEVMGRQFVGEKIYHAPEVEFIGRPWNLRGQILSFLAGTEKPGNPLLELSPADAHFSCR